LGGFIKIRGSSDWEENMKNVMFGLVFVVLLFPTQNSSVAAQTPNQRESKSTSLTNDDVVKMVKSGLAESTILLLIQQNATKFDTSAQAIISLKEQGVSQKILDAMLTVSSNKVPSHNTDSIASKENLPDVPEKSGFYYKGNDKWLELVMPDLAVKGRGAGSVLLGISSKTAISFGNSQAALRISGNKPVFYLRASDVDEAEMAKRRQNLGLADTVIIFRGDGLDYRYLYFFPLEQKKNNREVRVIFNLRTGQTGYPANIAIETTVTQLSKTLYSVTPKVDLKPGEYMLSGGFGSPIGFDFSILP
jgi:hypothetical protein